MWSDKPVKLNGAQVVACAIILGTIFVMLLLGALAALA